MKSVLELAKDIFNETLKKDKIILYHATRQQLWNESVDEAQEQWDEFMNIQLIKIYKIF